MAMVDKHALVYVVRVVKITSTIMHGAVVVTHCVEVHSDDLPHSAPLQPHTVHVVVGDLNDLLDAEHPRVGGAGELLVRHGTQRLNKVN
jgi:hypothetical protein